MHEELVAVMPEHPKDLDLVDIPNVAIQADLIDIIAWTWMEVNASEDHR